MIFTTRSILSVSVPLLLLVVFDAATSSTSSGKRAVWDYSAAKSKHEAMNQALSSSLFDDNTQGMQPGDDDVQQQADSSSSSSSSGNSFAAAASSASSGRVKTALPHKQVLDWRLTKG